MPPRASVIVCTRDRAAALAAALASIADQATGAPAPGPFEVLVIDQSAPPAAAANRAACATWGARWVPAPPDGLPAARNLGVRESLGTLLIFLDDDVHLLPGCLFAHLAAYADPWVGAVAGRVVERRVRPNARRLVNGPGWDGRIRAQLGRWEAGTVATAKGANMSFRRIALTTAGPCDEGFGGTAFLEDADWSLRVRAVGWRLVFAPDAAVVHHSAPAGGCRLPADEALRWRLHNTGRLLARHRPWTAALAVPSQVALAARSADPWAALTAGWRGFRDGLRARLTSGAATPPR